MKKRFLAMFLALVMCLALTVPAFAAYDYANGKCTYELSKEIIGTVEMDYHGEGTVTVYVVPDYTTIIPKNAPGARILSTYYLFDGWVAGSFELSNTDDPMVVRPILVQEGEEIEGGWLAFALLTEDVNAEGYNPDPDELPENFLDWDEEKFGEGAFRVISESAAKGLGLTIQPVTPDKPTVPATAPATPTDNSLTVDGKAVEPAAYMINGNNYFMLRDVAMLLNGSPKQFAVDWDEATESAVITPGQAYVPQGFELQGRPTANATANLSTDVIYFSGKKAELTIYKIGDNNYIKLRDLGILLDFYVDYDDATKSAFIDTNKPYDHNS